jgi:hypothetical protein
MLPFYCVTSASLLRLFHCSARRGNVCFHCCTDLSRYYGILVCHIAPSLRLLVPSSPQVRRQSVQMYHHHLRSKVALDLVDHAVDPGDASVLLCYICFIVASVSLLRASWKRLFSLLHRLVTLLWNPSMSQYIPLLSKQNTHSRNTKVGKLCVQKEMEEEY